MSKKYIDSRGWKYKVMSGFSAITPDSINESLPDWIEAFRTQPRKVGASEYWDDKAVRLPDTGGQT